MYEARTDHKIVDYGADLMQLHNSADGALIATATRAAGVWTVVADGVPDVTVPDRPSAIMALTEQALAALPGAGYSTMVPRGLAELP